MEKNDFPLHLALRRFDKQDAHAGYAQMIRLLLQKTAVSDRLQVGACVQIHEGAKLESADGVFIEAPSAVLHQGLFNLGNGKLLAFIKKQDDDGDFIVEVKKREKMTSMDGCGVGDVVEYEREYNSGSCIDVMSVFC